jgi:hypothetical protein
MESGNRCQMRFVWHHRKLRPDPLSTQITGSPSISRALRAARDKKESVSYSVMNHSPEL